MLTLRNNTPLVEGTGRSFFDRLFNDLFGELDVFDRGRRHVMFPFSGTDVYEDNGNLIYETEMPGLTRDEIKVRIENDSLIVSGEVKRDEKVKDDNYLSMGRRYGQFRRAFRLPQDSEVDAKKVSAKLENGVLRISIPLKESLKPQAIDVKVS